jgi:hypothetical protein
MAGFWFVVGIAGILTVIITAARRWERGRGSDNVADSSSTADLGYAGGGDDGPSCVSEGDACGDGGGGDGGGDGP